MAANFFSLQVSKLDRNYIWTTNTEEGSKVSDLDYSVNLRWSQSYYSSLHIRTFPFWFSFGSLSSFPGSADPGVEYHIAIITAAGFLKI